MDEWILCKLWAPECWCCVCKERNGRTCSQTAEKEKNPNNQTYYDAEIAAFDQWWKTLALAHQVNCFNIAIGGFASNNSIQLCLCLLKFASRFVPVAEVQATTGQLIYWYESRPLLHEWLDH